MTGRAWLDAFTLRAGIAIAPTARGQQTPVGAFVASANCFMWLHTTPPTIIDTESPIDRTYTAASLHVADSVRVRKDVNGGIIVELAEQIG